MNKFKQLIITVCIICFSAVIETFFLAPLTGQVLADETAGNEKCMTCHSFQDIVMNFPSGEVISLYVDHDEYASSVHGQLDMACTSCHTNISEYPHPPVTEQNYREYSLDLYPVCTSCHEQQIEEIQGNVHMVALNAENPAAAVCTDCHGKHNIQRVEDAITPINRTCGKCHGDINALYEQSVHGAALIGDGNPDVPTCTSCHGSHEIIGPSNYPFRLFSPQICAECHSNRELMARYGINPNVIDTYVSDFHGKTVTIFQDIAADQQTNAPVCIDCHGVHDILAPTDAHSSVMKANLLATCQKCHPNASTNFPDAWLSHYSPGPNQFKPIFYIKVLFWILIPVLTGIAFLFAGSDYFRQLRKLKRGI